MPGGGGRFAGSGREGVVAMGRVGAAGVGVGRATGGRGGAAAGRTTGSCGRGVGSIGTSTDPSTSVSRLLRRGATCTEGSRANGPAIVSTVAGLAVDAAPAAIGLGRVTWDGAGVDAPGGRPSGGTPATRWSGSVIAGLGCGIAGSEPVRAGG